MLVVLDSECPNFFQPVAEMFPCRAAVTVGTYVSAGRCLKCKADVAKDMGIMFFCAWGLMLTFF